MARFDEITGSNWLTKKEEKIEKSTTIFIIISIIDFFSMIFFTSRDYHFKNFPNFHLIGITLLFVITIIRINQAYKEGRDPYMDASRAWRERKGMTDAYDYIGPGPDYSNRIFNIIYFIGVIISFGLIILEISKYF